jgi:hypothetical protein
MMYFTHVIIINIYLQQQSTYGAQKECGGFWTQQQSSLQEEIC